MVEVCKVCEGSGLRIVVEEGRQVARPCECRIARRAEQLLARARIPRHFRDSSLENYEKYGSAHTSLMRALESAKHFLEGYPVETAGKGLLLTGSSGLGKTHLAVGLLKSLILDRGLTGVFWEQKELLETLRATYDNKTLGAENKILRSVTTCEVLVLDDLGDMTPSDWSWDTTSYILNGRYNENLTTIITTNLENRIGAAPPADPDDMFEKAKRANSQTTLGDQIGERMRSRLQEMCIVVEMRGEDFRTRLKRASFASSAVQNISASHLMRSAPQDGAALGKEGLTLAELLLSGRNKVDEAALAESKLTQEKAALSRYRMDDRKLVVTAPEVPTRAEKKEEVPMVWANGRLEPMLTRPPENVPQAPNQPLVGRDRMGQQAAPKPKRVVDADWRKS